MSNSENRDAEQRVGLEWIGECRVLRSVEEQEGVPTVEGDMVPLLSGQKIRSHMIVMHPGQYCFAHPHDTESIIYTVSGRWVFCTTENDEEVRVVINAGDLFHFPGGVPTGFETPFEEAASILIVKSGSESYTEMRESMEEVQGMLEDDAAKGTPYFMKELSADHPARVFASQVGGAEISDSESD
jgi:uncharacterized RmlC-like cupin family protein